MWIKKLLFFIFKTEIINYCKYEVEKHSFIESQKTCYPTVIRNVYDKHIPIVEICSTVEINKHFKPGYNVAMAIQLAKDGLKSKICEAIGRNIKYELVEDYDGINLQAKLFVNENLKT